MDPSLRRALDLVTRVRNLVQDAAVLARMARPCHPAHLWAVKDACAQALRVSPWATSALSSARTCEDDDFEWRRLFAQIQAETAEAASSLLQEVERLADGGVQRKRVM